MSLNEMDPPCEFLAWDSAFFGCRIARVVGHRLTPARMTYVHRWCMKHQIDCLYFLADSDQDETVVQAERNDFHLVDVRITLVLRGPEEVPVTTTGSILPAGTQLRVARTTDIAFLETIARTAHSDTRFYYDHHFPRDRCSDLYATWIRRSCEDFADQVLVAEYDGRVSGYITCSCSPDDKTLGYIGLVGVDARARGIGLGPALVKNSLHWFAERGVAEVRVVTQGRNTTAQRLYQRCGFLAHAIGLWYHKWFFSNRSSQAL